MLDGIRNLFGQSSALKPSRMTGTTKPNRFALETLEDRTTPAMFNPTTVVELIADIELANSNGAEDTIDLGERPSR